MLSAFLPHPAKQGGATIPVKDYVPSSPYFFGIVKTAMALLIAALLLLAMVIPAPLQEPGNLSQAPNPAKAAWFLLWIQELMGYSKHMIYAVILGGAYFLLLPYLPGNTEATKAEWLPKDQMRINIITLLTFFSIIVLTLIAILFRGENWAFVCPF